LSDSIVEDISQRSSTLLSEIEKTIAAIDETIFVRNTGIWPLAKQFYHLLYWLDYWFIDPLSFVEPSFHEAHFMKAETPSPIVPSKRQLFDYFNSIKARINDYLSDLSIEELKRTYEVRGKVRSRLDMVLGQFTHVNHHLGYICATSRALTGRSIWQEGAPV
jgi:hypothetical protein